MPNYELLSHFLSKCKKKDNENLHCTAKNYMKSTNSSVILYNDSINIKSVWSMLPISSDNKDIVTLYC